MPKSAMFLSMLLVGCGTETGLTPDADGESPLDPADPVPIMEVSPQEIGFDPVIAGDRASEIFTVTNVGEAELEIVDVAFSQGDPDFSFQALDGTVLSPGASADWSVSYAPDAPSVEVESATIAITGTDPERPQAKVNLYGSTRLPAFEISPAHHDFGVVPARDQASVELVVTNTGDAPGALERLVFTPTSSELSLADLGELDSLPAYLDPGDSLSLTGVYQPVDAVADEATVEITTSAPDTPSVVAVLEGTGEVTAKEVEIFLTADDAWTGYIDGVEFTATNQSSWTHGDTHTVTLEGGPHVIAIEATDVGSVISGFIAVVKVDGTIVSRTGEGDWMMTPTTPGSGWQTVGFDDSAWNPAVKCSDPGTWGTYWPKPFYDEGAEWVWWTSACRNLKTAWFRMELEI